MSGKALRRVLWIVLLAVPVVAWFSMSYDRYAVDGDAVAYMDIADLLQAHRWAGVVNAYWHPLYPLVLLAGRLLFHAEPHDRAGRVLQSELCIAAAAGRGGAVLLHGGVSAAGPHDGHE